MIISGNRQLFADAKIKKIQKEYTIRNKQSKIEYDKKYRKENAALIKKLKADKLSAATSINATTSTNIKAVIKDSIIYKDRVVPIDTVKQIKYNSKWASIYGYLANDTISLNIINREELLVVESFVKKRFIGIKLPIWLFGYKTKSVNVVSKNPNTEINNLEYIQIYK